MKVLRWQFLIALLALVAISVLLLTQKAPLPSIIPSEPVTGGNYTEALIGQPGRFNPVLSFYNPADQDINRLIFSGLIRFDDRGLPQPDLAESWGISRDATIYNFALRLDLRWHDGEALTSDDVLFTVDLLRNADLPIPSDVRALWNETEVIALDERTVQFRLPEPFAPFLDYLSFGILPRHLLDGLSAAELLNSDFNLSPVGSGPYRFERLLIEDGRITGVALQAYDGYRPQPPFIEQWAFLYYPTAEAALNAYQNGEVQGISEITNDILPQALGEPQLNLYTGRLPKLSMVLFNLQNADVSFFQEAEVRRALYAGLNRQWMIDHLLGGQAIPATGVIFPGTWAYYDGLQSQPYDPDAAIQQIKDAGYILSAEGVRTKDDLSLTFELLYPDDETHRALAETIQENWKALGVQVRLTPVAYADLVGKHLVTRDFQAALVDLDFSGVPDPDPYPFWHQSAIQNGQNYGGWDDRPASEYLEQARVTVDPAERARLYQNFQVRFEEMLPALPLFYPVYTYGVDADVQGVRMGPLYHPSDRFLTVSEWFLQARPVIQPAATP